MKLNLKKQRFKQILNGRFFLVTSLVIFSCTQVQARQTPSGQSNRPAATVPNVVFAAPPLPPGTGAPTGRRSGAGSRGCGNINSAANVADKKHLTALVPSIQSNEFLLAEFVGGLTTAERPTFWFYITYQPPFTGQFILQDKDENVIYKTNVILPAKPGVMRISLPSNLPPLEIGKVYNWYFNITCESDAQRISSVNGWIQRTSLNTSVETQLQNATPQQKVSLYASNGIWYEALTTAAELRRNNSNDQNWANLLQEVGLSEIASAAIAEN